MGDLYCGETLYSWCTVLETGGISLRKEFIPEIREAGIFLDL